MCLAAKYSRVTKCSQNYRAMLLEAASRVSDPSQGESFYKRVFKREILLCAVSEREPAGSLLLPYILCLIHKPPVLPPVLVSLATSLGDSTLIRSTWFSLKQNTRASACKFSVDLV